MTKVISLTVLHYGSSYLGAALRSVVDHVDECWIAYTPVGSHGSRTSEPCPDTRQQLVHIAREAVGDKLRWYDGIWPYEGAQRDSIYTKCPDADAIIVVDSDEIWHPDTCAGVNVLIHQSMWPKDTRNWRLPMVHFWRSFYKANINDPAWPVRVIFPKAAGGEMYLDDLKPIAHMGYAQGIDITRYKILTHGHRGEWRQDWFDTKFLPNAQTDVHPTNHNYWNPVTVNPLDYLPDWMQSHPYYHLDVIE